MQAHDFRFYFTPLTGVLFTFPSRYWFTIGHRLVFSLGGWSPRVQSEFHVFRPTWDTRRGQWCLRIRGCHPVSRNFPEASADITHCSIRKSRNPRPQAVGFRLFRVRSPLLTESRLISFPPGTEMFHFPGYCLPALCIQTGMYAHDSVRVSPFGNPRIKARLPLPEAYRSLPRPSSPAGAKASIMCPK